jgi:cell division transport system ATP-binding protein
MIKFDNVSKIYPNGQIALDNINLQLRTGEMLFLTGHSGAGKSTLLKLVMGIISASSGVLTVNGLNVNKLTSRQLPFYRRHIGTIQQNPLLLTNRTVFENIEIPLIIAGIDITERKRRVRAALDKVGLLHKEKAYPHALSTGEQQRASIARAVVNKPHIILADEPTGNLDPVLSTEIMRLFEAFRQVGVCILIATHDLALIARMQYKIITLTNGRLLEIEETEFA